MRVGRVKLRWLRPFPDDTCYIFSTTGEARKEPDILTADPELGLIIIKVKSLRMEQISTISGHRWAFRNVHSVSISPYQQGENQLWALLGYCDQEPALRRKVAGRVLVALPWIDSSEWLERGFHTLPSCPPILFGDNLSRAALLNTVKDAPQVTFGDALPDEAFKTRKGILAGTSVYRKAERDEPTVEGRALILAQAREQLYAFDL